MRVGLIYGIYFEDRQGRCVKLLQKVFGCVIFYFQIFLSRQTDSDVSLIFDVLRVRRKRARRIGNLHKIFIYRIFSTALFWVQESESVLAQFARVLTRGMAYARDVLTRGKLRAGWQSAISYRNIGPGVCL